MNGIIKVNGKTLRRAAIKLDSKERKCTIEMQDGKAYAINMDKNVLLINVFGELGEKVLKNVYDIE